MTLAGTGLSMPADFPENTYEAIYALAQQKHTTWPAYGHFRDAFHALAFRYRAAKERGDEFIGFVGSGIDHERRYRQEEALFGFFSAASSVFECAFFGIFAVGAFLAPGSFPIVTADDQRRVTPSRTRQVFASQFPGDPLNMAIANLLGDPHFEELREIRNALTHRASPGRTFYVSVGSNDNAPDQWKLKNITLDVPMMSGRQAELSRMLGDLLAGLETFVRARF